LRFVSSALNAPVQRRHPEDFSVRHYRFEVILFSLICCALIAIGLWFA